MNEDIADQRHLALVRRIEQLEAEVSQLGGWLQTLSRSATDAIVMLYNRQSGSDPTIHQDAAAAAMEALQAVNTPNTED